MHAEFKELKPFVHEFKLVNMPFALNDILAEVQAAHWPTWKSLGDTRFKDWKPFGPISQTIHTFFSTDDFQQQLINVMDQRPEFHNDYWHELKHFKTGTEPMFEFNVDTPGFSMNPHLDNREIVIVGMCHFIEGDDTNQSTTFYTDKAGSDPLRIPTGFGIGWASANINDSWHSGHNLSNKNRFSVKFGTKLKLK